MNEVSFRNDILDAIDEIVTESSTDVLFSMLDASEKAMVILENCTDEDDIWKYSVWQEADENKSEEIDKDKHPFKESSTLKTILMLPINLIKLIFKTISQAFSPQKAEESSKLAAVAEKSKTIAQKIVPFFFTPEGELNIPVTVVTGAAGGGLTIDAIIRKNHSLVVRAVNGVINTWTKIIRRLKGMGVDSVPEKFEFTANKSDSEKFDVSLDFEKADAYIDAMKKLIDELPGKIDAIAKTTDEKKKESSANDLRKEILAITRTCPIYRGVKTYTSKEIVDFYTKVTSKATQLNQGEIDKFTNAYKPIADGSNDKHTKAVATGISNTFAVFNAFLAAVNSIKTANDAINKVIVQATEYTEIRDKTDTAPDGFPDKYYMLDDKGNMVKATGNWNKDTAYFTKNSETPAENTSQPQASTGDQSQDEYEEVTDKTKAPDGFPNGYFTKDADGNYVPVADSTQFDSNATYYKKKTEAAPANNDAGADNPTDNPGDTPPAKTGENDNPDDTGAPTDQTDSEPDAEQTGPQTLTAQEALDLIRTNKAYAGKNVYIDNKTGIIKLDKTPFLTKPLGLAVSVDGKERRLKVKVDNGKRIYVLEYAVADDFDIVDTHYTAYVEFYDEETGDIVEEAFVDEDNDVCYVLEGGSYLGGGTVKRIYTPKSKFTVDVNDDPISIEDDKQLEEKLASLDSAKDRTRTVKIKPTAKGLTVDYISTKVSNNKSVRVDTGHRLVITGAAAVKKSNIMRNKDNVEKTSKQGKTIRIGKLGEEQKKSLKPDRDKAVQESYDASIDATVSSWYNK